MSEATHKELWKVCRDTEEYQKGQEANGAKWKPDCSTGCHFFHELKGKRGMDWGICFNPKSPRYGLLTFEHMWCDFHQTHSDEYMKRLKKKQFKAIKDSENV